MRAMEHEHNFKERLKKDQKERTKAFATQGTGVNTFFTMAEQQRLAKPSRGGGASDDAMAEWVGVDFQLVRFFAFIFYVLVVPLCN